MGLNDSIDYHFMVVGHTKNHCDAYFGLIKREMKKQDVWTPKDMMADVERSATSSSICRPGSDVQRADWKFLLAKYFKVTGIPGISTASHFQFSSEYPGHMVLRPSSANAAVKAVSLLQSGVSPAVIRANATSDLAPFGLPSQALNEIRATAKLNRREYLQREVLDRYVATQPEVQAEYFTSGTGRE